MQDLDLTSMENKNASMTKDQTMLLLDWDDTLLPTAFIQQSGFRLEGPIPGPELQQELNKLAAEVKETLELAQTLGTVIIVTNAENGWVELTTQRFFTGLAEELENIEVISARSKHEPTGISSPLEWKLRTFQEVIDKKLEEMKETIPTPSGEVTIPSDKKLNVISIGDSTHEREAILKVTEGMSQVLCKSLKLMERPDLDQMTRQHGIIRSCLENITRHDEPMDLCIQVSHTSEEEEDVVMDDKEMKVPDELDQEIEHDESEDTKVFEDTA